MKELKKKGWSNDNAHLLAELGDYIDSEYSDDEEEEDSDEIEDEYDDEDEDEEEEDY